MEKNIPRRTTTIVGKENDNDTFLKKINRQWDILLP